MSNTQHPPPYIPYTHDSSLVDLEAFLVTLDCANPVARGLPTDYVCTIRIPYTHHYSPLDLDAFVMLMYSDGCIQGYRHYINSVRLFD
eukprot:jgi/Chrzof1/8164/Cz03g00040.t1